MFTQKHQYICYHSDRSLNSELQSQLKRTRRSSITGTSCWASSSCPPACRNQRACRPSLTWFWTRFEEDATNCYISASFRAPSLSLFSHSFVYTHTYMLSFTQTYTHIHTDMLGVNNMAPYATNATANHDIMFRPEGSCIHYSQAYWIAQTRTKPMCEPIVYLLSIV